MVGLQTDPPFCLPDVATKLIVTSAVGDTQRVRVKSAPLGSTYYRADGSEVPLPSVLDAPERVGLETVIFTADVSGKYVLVIEDVNAKADRVPTYEGSPNQLHTESILSRTTVNLYVSEKLTLQINAAGTSVSLLLYLNNQTVHATTPEVYGASIGKTPRLENARDSKARIAAQSVLPSVLVGETSTDLLGDFAAFADELAQRLEQHADANGSVHLLDDVPVMIQAADAQGSPSTQKGLQDQLNKIHRAYSQHIRNETDGYRSHLVPDYRNVCIAPGAGDPASSVVLLADLWRCIASHFLQVASPASHDNADGQVITTPGSLIVLLGDYLEELAKLSPQAPSTSNPGAVQLIASGFVSQNPASAQIT